jgi:hypothetical protein
MSHLTITIDEFMRLSPQAHARVVKMCTAEINHLKRLSKLDKLGGPDDLANRAALEELRQVRKVHQGRLDELNAEAGLLPAAETNGFTVAIAA